MLAESGRDWNLSATRTLESLELHRLAVKASCLWGFAADRMVGWLGERYRVTDGAGGENGKERRQNLGEVA